LVCEVSSSSWRQGATTGSTFGQKSRAAARALNPPWPDDRPIYLAFDSAVQVSEMDTAKAHMKAFNHAQGLVPQAPYGTDLLIRPMFAANLIAFGWQTNARGWFGNTSGDCPFAAAIQHTSHSYPQFPSSSYDENTLRFDDWGQVPAPGVPMASIPPCSL